MKMLLVDDDPLYRKVLTGLARQFEYVPLVAKDGEEGWALYQEHRPPFVLTDWMMPELTGVELCRRIRTDDPERRPYIILVTTLSDNERVLEGFQAGADDYIAKPFDRRVFESHVKAASERVRFEMRQEEGIHRDVVVNYQGALGHESPELLHSLGALSRIYTQQRIYSKARGFLRRQISIAKRMGDEAAVGRLEKTIAELNAAESTELETPADDNPESSRA